MEFSSMLFVFAVLPIVMIIYYIIPKKYSDKALFAISLLYMFTFGLKAMIAVAAFMTINYGIYRLIEKIKHKKWLGIGLFSADFVINIVFALITRQTLFSDTDVLGSFSSQISFIGTIILAMSAIGAADEARCGESIEKNFIKYGLYIIYFPKFIAGPYISCKDFMQRLSASEKKLEVFGEGCSTFVKGLSKKVVIADSIYSLWYSVSMLDPDSISVLTSWLSVLAFGLSLYFTLLGITDMARGISIMFGINLEKSFRYPIFSMGMNEFASHWHISIVEWLKSYIYKPTEHLSDNRLINIMKAVLLWCCVGVIYDYSLNKLIWGLIIALSLMLEKLLSKRYYGKLPAFLFSFVATNIGWIFFMENSPVSSLKFIKAVTGGTGNIVDITGVYLLRSYVLILLIGIYFSTDLFKNLIERSRGRKYIETAVGILSPFVIVLLLAASTIFMINKAA